MCRLHAELICSIRCLGWSSRLSSHTAMITFLLIWWYQVSRFQGFTFLWACPVLGFSHSSTIEILFFLLPSSSGVPVLLHPISFPYFLYIYSIYIFFFLSEMPDSLMNMALTHPFKDIMETHVLTVCCHHWNGLPFLVKHTVAVWLCATVWVSGMSFGLESYIGGMPLCLCQCSAFNSMW